MQLFKKFNHPNKISVQPKFLHEVLQTIANSTHSTSLINCSPSRNQKIKKKAAAKKKVPFAERIHKAFCV